MSKDIPIIFSGPMVRALLDGRKTMTRRILKPQPAPFLVDEKPCEVGLMHVDGDPRPRVTLGRVITKQEIRFAAGDRLWVRENLMRKDHYIHYAADGAIIDWEIDRAGSKGRTWPTTWLQDPRPSIHMPRDASRLTLIVTGVKVEQLQHLSDADALSEGIVEDDGGEPGIFYLPGGWQHKLAHADRPSTVFRSLWEHLHGVESWESNPFVVAISFRVVAANINSAAARLAA